MHASDRIILPPDPNHLYFGSVEIVYDKGKASMKPQRSQRGREPGKHLFTDFKIFSVFSVVRF